MYELSPLWFATDGTKNLSVEDRPNIAIDVVEVLLEGKADIEMLNGNGAITLLGRAAMRGDSEVVSLLLKHKARIDKVGAGGLTPLLHAASQGHAAVVALLLESKANFEARRGSEGTSLILAAAVGRHVRMMRSMIDEASGLSEKDRKFHRYRFGIKETEKLTEFVESVELLLDHGANVYAKDEFDRTVLEIAADGECPEIVQLLVFAGAWDGKEQIEGTTPEMHAVMQEVMQELLYAQKSVEKQDWLPEELLKFSLLRKSLKGQSDEVIPGYLENSFFTLCDKLPVELNEVIDEYATQYTTNDFLNRRIRKLIFNNRRVSEQGSEQQNALSGQAKSQTVSVLRRHIVTPVRALGERVAASARALRRLFE